jgi:uncharacterized protein
LKEKRMTKFIAILSTAAIIAFAPAFPANADEQADRLGAAREVLTAIHATDNFLKMLPTLMTQLQQMFVQINPKMEADLNAMAPRLIEKAKDRAGELIDQIAKTYAARFTVKELHDIKTFYESPTGIKLTSQQPQIAMESMAVGRTWGLKLGEELKEEMKTELRKKGYPI